MDEQCGTKPASPSPVPGPEKYGLEYVQHCLFYRSYTLAILYLVVFFSLQLNNTVYVKFDGHSVLSSNLY